MDPKSIVTELRVPKVLYKCKNRDFKVRPHGQKFGHKTLYNKVVRHKTCTSCAKSCYATNVHKSTIFFLINLARLRLAPKLQVTSFLVFIQYVWWRRRFCIFSCYNCGFQCCDCRPPRKKTPSSSLNSAESSGEEKILHHGFYERPHTSQCRFIIVRIQIWSKIQEFFFECPVALSSSYWIWSSLK